jgi:hypothetical protein
MCSGMTRTAPHERWSRRQRFDDTHADSAFDHHFNAVLTTTAARDLLDEQIVAVVAAHAASTDRTRPRGEGQGFRRPLRWVVVRSSRCFPAGSIVA